MKELLKKFTADWGDQIELDDAAVVAISTGPGSVQFTANAHCFLILLTPQPAWHLAMGSCYGPTGMAPVGSVQILPCKASISACWTAEMEGLLVAVREERLARMIGENAARQIDWSTPNAGGADGSALAMAREIRKEVGLEAVARHDCVNAWVTLLMGHLLRNYSTLNNVESRAHIGGLSARARRKIAEYLEANLTERVCLQEMAAVAQLSASHFARAFRTTFGVSPHQYVVSLRLMQARQWVINSDLPLDHIARAVGFSNNSHLTAAMRRHFGTTPSQIRYAHRGSGASASH